MPISPTLPAGSLEVRVLLREDARLVAVAGAAAGLDDGLRVVAGQRVLVRAVLGHAVDVLRRDAHGEEALRHLARDRRAGHVEQAHRAELRHAAALRLGEEVDGVRRHAHDVGRAALERPVDRLRAGGRVVEHQLEARGHHLLDGDGADVMAHRRQAEQDRRMIVAPVGHHRAAVGEQRVVRVHHPLGHPGGARGEGEVDDLVGVGDRGQVADRARRRERRSGEVEHVLDRGRSLNGARAITGLHHERRGPRTLEQLRDLGRSVVLVQRGDADIAVPRAREQGDHALGARGQPHRHPLAAAHAGLVQGGGDRIDPGEQLAPGKPDPRVAQRVRPRALCGVLLEQRVQRVRAPCAGSVVARRLLRIEQGENGIHAASGRTCPDRVFSWRGTPRPARATPRSRGSRAAADRAPCAPGRRRRRGAR